MSEINLLLEDDCENSCCESDEEFNSRSRRKRAGECVKNSSAGGGGNNSRKMATVVRAAASGSSPQRTADAAEPSVNMSSEDAGHVEAPAVDLSATSSQMFNEDRLRRKLQFFFMNPIEKWQARKKFPYKFVVQLVKIVLVTMQLCLFAHSRYNHVNYTEDNRLSFSHLFLRGWDATMEVEAYPPATGALALYEKQDFFDTIDYAVKRYKNLSIAIGPYSYPTDDNSMAPLRLCLDTYREGTIFGFNESYIFNPEIDRHCFSLTENVTTIGTEAFLKSMDFDVNFAALVKASLKFVVKTVNFKAYGPLTAPDCYKFHIYILFDNRDHDGQMLLSLTADAMRLHCRGNMEYITDTELDSVLRSILNFLVILICILSFALCARALYRAQLLRIKTQNFFRTSYNKEISWDGKMEFLNFWYIMITINDIMLIIGSAIKEQIERKYFVTNGWDVCSLFLGVGNLLVWFGVLRYLGFFKTYNVVILTLKRAAPKIFRFLLCALLIYAGFTFCGWLILGPYHMKFRSLSTTSECLFALINGDDMFATFTTMSANSTMLWWFCRIYLYSFISLYIYVVLSLFISVIMDAYDTIKKYYREGFPQSDLRAFVGVLTEEELTSGAFRFMDEEDEVSFVDQMKNLLFCRKESTESEGPTGYTRLDRKPM